MSELLAGFGFEVFMGTDLSRQEFERLLDTGLLNAGDRADIVFFFAGHGIQIGSRNYLLPVDANLEKPGDLPLYSITVDRLMDRLSRISGSRVMLIDACRDNPFAEARMLIGL